MSFTCKYGGLCDGCMRCMGPAREGGPIRMNGGDMEKGEGEDGEGGVEIEKERSGFERQLRAAEMAEQVMTRAFRDKDQFKRHIVSEKRDKDTVTEEYVMNKYDFKALGEAVKALRELEELKRALLGQGTGAEGAGGLVVIPEREELDGQ